MTAQDKFKELLNSITPIMTGQGFVRKGQKFLLEIDGNVGTLLFFRSPQSTKEQIPFYAHFEMQLQLLAKHLFWLWAGGDHWSKSICSYLPGKHPYGPGVITPDTDIAALIKKLRPALRKGSQELRSYLHDETYRDCLLTEYEAGDAHLESLVQLSALLVAYGPIEYLDEVLTVLKYFAVDKRDLKSHLIRLKRIKPRTEKSNASRVEKIVNKHLKSLTTKSRVKATTR